MCDCAPSIPPSYVFGGSVRKPEVDRCNYMHRRSGNSLPYWKIFVGIRLTRCCSFSRDLKPRSCINQQLYGKGVGIIFQQHMICCGFSNQLGFSYFGFRVDISNPLRVSRNSGEFKTEKYESPDQVLGTRPHEKQQEPENVRVDMATTAGVKEEEKSSDGASVSSFDFLELKRELDKEERITQSLERLEEEEDLFLGEGFRSTILEPGKNEAVKSSSASQASKSGRQMLRRSSLLAKKVISMQSACSLGFISQLWVDTRSWVVVVVEVRPSLLSGEMEKFLLEDVHQVGDVVLVQNESVIDNDVKMIGLDTLVGYNVLTSSRRSVGKVRNFNFNVNSGVVESLELDSFGMSIIPSSLVSTYSLFVEDVLEVVSDTVLVHEGALSRVQRLTKGLWDAGTVDTSIDEFGESPSSFRRTESVPRRRSRKGVKFPSKQLDDTEDDWDIPMDFS